jgi:hypothetical protein
MVVPMTNEALVVSRNSGRALVDAGGRFMVGDEIEPHAKELGMQPGGLYFRGRIGALGEVSSQVATATLGIFPRRVVDFTWHESAALPAKAAVNTYRGLRACAGWGRRFMPKTLSGAISCGPALRTARTSGHVVCRPMRGAR